MTLHILQCLPSPHNDGRQGWHVIIGWNLKGKPDYVGGYGWGVDGVEAAAKAYGDAAETLARRRPRVEQQQRQQPELTLFGAIP